MFWSMLPPMVSAQCPGSELDFLGNISTVLLETKLEKHFLRIYNNYEKLFDQSNLTAHDSFSYRGFSHKCIE